MSSTLVRVSADIDDPPRLTAEQKAELAELGARNDASIDYSDIAQVADFSGFVALRDRHLYRPHKQSTTLRIDADVLQWLKSKGKGYQTRLNAILRAAMEREGV